MQAVSRYLSRLGAILFAAAVGLFLFWSLRAGWLYREDWRIDGLLRERFEERPSRDSDGRPIPPRRLHIVRVPSAAQAPDKVSFNREYSKGNVTLTVTEPLNPYRLFNHEILIQALVSFAAAMMCYATKTIVDRTTPAPVLVAIRDLLRSKRIDFRHVHHKATPNWEESASLCRVKSCVWVKALLMRADENEFLLFVIPADRKIDMTAVRGNLGFEQLRFATAEELKSVSGLVRHAVPPFGRPILPVEVYVDEAIQSAGRNAERIAFSAGSLTDSIVMTIADYQSVVKPRDVLALSSA